MVYRTYITEALVCGSKANHTSDRTFLLFTREAGMLYAVAKSVREERSTQRFALQEFSYLRATLIHGKAGWRLAGVEPIAHLYARATTRAARSFLRTILLLLRRTMHGEVAHPDIFDDVTQSLMQYEEPQLVALETVLSLRILHALGYVATPAELEPLIAGTQALTSLSEMTDSRQALCREQIETALRESQL
jgi:recombinational DNA repair protein (RecF pathway)